MTNDNTNPKTFNIYIKTYIYKDIFQSYCVHCTNNLTRSNGRALSINH